MRAPFVVISILVLMTGACSSGGTRSSAPVNSRNRSSAITAEELASTPLLDAFDAVRRLRPIWLRTRGAITMSLQGQAGVRVYVNGSARGYVEELKSIRATNVESIRYLSPPQATTRFGIDHANGAILVVLKR